MANLAHYLTYFNSFQLPLVLSVLGLVCTLYIWSRPNESRRLPPGPKGLPFLGNIFQITQFQWLQFTEWKKEFGPIFSLNFAGQPVIVLNSHEVVGDLLDRRSAIYSSRPRFIMASEILTGGMFIPLQPYGETWRRMRKAAHEGLNTRAAETYQPLQEVEAATLVSGLMKEPEAWEDHIKRSAASSVKMSVYGSQPIESKDDPLVRRVNSLVTRVALACLPGAYMVEIFPVMLHLPKWLAPWKRDGLEWHRKDTAMLQEFMDGVRKEVDQGTNKPSFASNLYLNADRHQLSPMQESWLAGTMFAGGSDTTSAALSFFILAMRLYPDVMKKAQAQIDTVVGRDRLPTFADRENLPYIRAIVKEVLRWRPVGPLGLPRRTTQDDYYNGYFIPKGALIIANVWAMNRDPEVFPDFDEFRPERFLDESGTVDVVPPNTHTQGHVTFGFGRRICVGMNIANQALFIDVASLLSAASIEPAFDSEGKIIVPSRSECIDEGLVVRPVPFQCKIVPRAINVDSMLSIARGKLAQ
ncbi:cytochrome P450 [Pluteus cervinus]|uniref:Cytochrome P450 n=1 Tax=Pluteus cervinus TaxID=181527 RepID=A0ACD3AE52_9AGAR|nr:cytochrome P450 [Pluteus cervinus]